MRLERCAGAISPKDLKPWGWSFFFFMSMGEHWKCLVLDSSPYPPPPPPAHTHPKYSEKLCCSLLVSALSNNTHGGEMETEGAEGDVDP